MRIGIYVGWNCQEAAYMAGQLADRAALLGHAVSILSSQPLQTPVYERWDHEVEAPGRDFKAWAKAQRTIVWFEICPEKLRLARAAGCRNVLVLLWHRISPAEVPLLAEFANVVCPSKSCVEHAVRSYPHARYTLTEWDPGTPYATPVPHDEPHKVFVPLDGQSARRYGPMILHAIRIVMARSPGLNFTLGRAGHWSRATVQAAGEAMRETPKRVVTFRRRGWQEWVGELAKHDWLFNPVLQDNACLTTTAAAYLRIPIVAFDVPPATDLLRDGKNAMLVRCELQETAWGVPTAVPTPKPLVDVLDNVLGNRPLGKALVGAYMSRRLERRRMAFNEFWETELEKTDPWA